eukprot:CAMPEP_0114498794 /NCGR_PEP_ID=MMETSP0109-20121206/7066_1 /TAXON_ID=29199 /ORGANISM="Chlorarachnion reptans, Strain CCCM449" /LENGTH=122 /DNA_ID=CAMNT_0001676303 /DNA_START=93 /DNA_END=461 /DNA_ORIENTATION=-
MGQKIKELREKMKTARTLYRAEKTNKKLERAYHTSKQELHKAKEKKKAKLSLKKESKAPECVVPAGCFSDRKGDRNLVLVVREMTFITQPDINENMDWFFEFRTWRLDHHGPEVRSDTDWWQ